MVVSIVMTACGSGGTTPVSTDQPSVWSIIADAGKGRTVPTGTSVQVSGADSLEITENKVLNYQ